MSQEATRVQVKHSFTLEKRNDAGELYEVVEVEAGERGAVDARVTFRQHGLAPAEAYAQDVMPLKAPNGGT